MSDYVRYWSSLDSDLIRIVAGGRCWVARLSWDQRAMFAYYGPIPSDVATAVLDGDAVLCGEESKREMLTACERLMDDAAQEAA